MDRWRIETLELAATLGWPELPFDFCGELIVVPGDEAGWRAWVAKDWGDERIYPARALEWALAMIETGKEPGSPETWSEKAILSEDARKGMDIEDRP
jgi:hypothetical protein